MAEIRPTTSAKPKVLRHKPLPPPVAGRPPELQAWIQRVKALPTHRQEKVTAIREAVAGGTYDVDSRLLDLLYKMADSTGDASDE